MGLSWSMGGFRDDDAPGESIKRRPDRQRTDLPSTFILVAAAHTSRAIRSTLGALVWLALLALSCANRPPEQAPQQAQLTKAISAPERLAPPEDLSGLARGILRARMASHVQDMSALMSAVMILNYPLIEERAAKIASDVSLARPLTGDATELNSALPEKFFAYQDEIRKAATVLGAAAAEKSAFRVADGYGRLSETCVRCHATYREGQPQASKSPLR